jgi:signal transduction histidine kinase
MGQNSPGPFNPCACCANRGPPTAWTGTGGTSSAVHRTRTGPLKMKDSIKVLLFEDSSRDAELLKEMLHEGAAAEQARKKEPIAPFYVQNVTRLRDGLDYLATANADLILLDLALLDSQGLDTFARVHAQAPNVPLIVLTGHDDEDIAIRTVHDGAQDYLVKGRIDAHMLVRAIRYAVERKRSEDIIRRAKEEAEFASDAKGQFLSRMSHELRTPLNAILGFAQLLETDSKLTDRESVDQILKAGRHLLALINEVLEFSRLEAGRVDLPLEPVNVAGVVREALNLIRPLAASQKISVMGEDALNSSLHVQANPQRLKQVLLNLLSNAVKYNRPDGSVTVSCEKSLRPRDTVELRKTGGATLLRISIADTGLGIAPHNLSKLFIPFERVGAEESGIEGTGLGLAVSKGLVQAMGGVIAAESDLGRGSVFSIELPAAENSLPGFDSETEHLLSQIQNSASPIQNPKTVLYVEDNLSNLRLIDRVLAGRPGIKLLSAVRGALGLDLARQHRPDLILLDLNLPDMHGADVLRSLQENPHTASIAVVVISADATAAQIERLLAAGARDYLTKPIDVKQFLVTVDDLLRQDQSHPNGGARRPQIAGVPHG